MIPCLCCGAKPGREGGNEGRAEGGREERGGDRGAGRAVAEGQRGFGGSHARAPAGLKARTPEGSRSLVTEC